MAYYRKQKKARKPLAAINFEGTMLSRLSKGTKLFKEIKDERVCLITGVVLAVDPSCGSISSMPGWAVYSSGQLQDSGTISLPVGETLQLRLQTLAAGLEKIVKVYNPDVLVYEDVPAVRFHSSGRTSSGSQASLLKAVGVVLAVPIVSAAIGLRPSVWKRLVSASYTKSDENDAVEMGSIAIKIAQEIQNDIHSKGEAKEKRRLAGRGVKSRANKSNVPARR